MTDASLSQNEINALLSGVGKYLEIFLFHGIIT